jgi:hypothetical protein
MTLPITQTHPHAQRYGMTYLRRLPRTIPPRRWLVHNFAPGRLTRRLGDDGFRAWLAAPDATRYTRCPCAWAAALGDHYRVRTGGRDSPRFFERAATIALTPEWLDDAAVNRQREIRREPDED